MIDLLKTYRDGLIAITPGETGKIEKLCMKGKKAEASEVIDTYASIFDELYLSLQRYPNKTNESLVECLYSLSKEKNIPVVATNDVRYLERSDASAFHCMTCIRDGKKMSEIKVGEEQYFKSQQEMADLFSDIPDALENTVKIVNKCHVHIETKQKLLPKYPLKQGEHASEYLKELCVTGLKNRIKSPEPKYSERLHYELTIIDQMGFNDYFLIVWDFMKYAREQGILTGPGRGSVAGSLVAFVLGITDVDPIEHGLLFERFLNPERISMPDIDIDFSDHRRDDVIHYVKEKYGKQHVAQIITFGTFGAKAAIRDVARVFNLNTKEIDRLSKLVPSRIGMTLAQAYEETVSLRTFVQASKTNKKIFSIAKQLEGLPRHTSTHAAGIIISEHPLVNHVPVQGGESGIHLTQFPMEDLEEIGLLKMDFLGLRNLSLLERVAVSIRLTENKHFNMDEIPRHDEQTILLLQKGDTTGIFQLESEGMRNVLRELKPTEFEDIVAVNALFRPGPMENIPHYIARKHGKKTIVYPHPDLEPILHYTYGIIVYQEQIMQIASKMAGYSLGEADLLRRAISKKSKDVLDRERIHFVNGATQRGYDEKVANDTYNLIVRFANYGFNRSHAVAYSIISWKLAYLKAHFPSHFMAALLTSVIGNEDKIAIYLTEARRKGIQIFPPSINKSHFPFKVIQKGIRYSLAAIRGIGISALREILAARKLRPFHDLFDLCLRLPQRSINRKTYEALIHAGALDEFGYDRATLLATLDVAMDHAQLMKPDGENDLFAGEELFKIQPKYIDAEPIRIADKLFYEKSVLGVFLSNHPTDSYTSTFQRAGVASLIDLRPGQKNIACGVYLSQVRPIRTKKGDAMAFLKISDASAELEAVIFPDAYRKYMSFCKEGNVIYMTGHVEKRNDQIQLIVQQMKSMEELMREVQKLYLKVPAELHEQNTFNQLREIFQEYRGNTPIILHYEKTKKTIQIAKKDWIEPASSCIEKLKFLLGDQSVVLK